MRLFWGIEGLVIATAAACAAPPPAPPPGPPPPPPAPKADLVLKEGRVHTLDPAMPSASAVAVMGSKIVAVGDEDTVATWVGPSTRVIRLSGRTVVPGLIDSHMHLVALGTRRGRVDLVGADTLADVLARVKAAAAQTPPGRWILGRGWDQNDWSDHRGFPTARDLDRVAGDHPVFLGRIDGHAGWANSAALRIAGITGRTPDPAGGQIIKRRGRPTGIFIDNATALIEGHIPPPTDAQLEQAILQGQDECLASGLTEVHEMGLGPKELDALRRLDDAGKLRLRVYAMISGSLEDLTPFMEAGPRIAEDNQRLTIRGLKFYMDGALGSRGAAMLEPYADAKKQTGLLLTPLSMLEARVRTAKTHGFQVAVHAIGDRANREVLDIFERVYGKDDGTHRPRIEHAQVIHPEDLPRFASLNVIASMQPIHATSDMPWAEKRVGPERIRGAYAWKTLLRSGAVLAAGSDAPVEEISPLLGLYAAITRKDLLGFPKSGWYPDERMSPQEALVAFSAAGTYASFREKDAGRIAVGRTADLTVLDKDILTANEDDLASLQAMLTIVGGRVEFAKPGAEVPPPTVTTSTRATSAP